jgi:hypothetical protein
MKNKNKIIITIIAVAILGVFGYEFYLINQVKKEADLSYQSILFLSTPDKDKITGFDKLVVQTINKLNSNGKK